MKDIQKDKLPFVYLLDKIGHGEWNEEFNLKTIKSLKKWKVLNLRLSNVGILKIGSNKCSQIIYDIVEIRMENLSLLSLIGNKIVSIEVICRLNVPSLTELYLSMYVMMERL